MVCTVDEQELFVSAQINICIHPNQIKPVQTAKDTLLYWTASDSELPFVLKMLP